MSLSADQRLTLAHQRVFHASGVTLAQLQTALERLAKLRKARGRVGA